MYMLENTRKFSMHLIFDVDYEYCRIYEQENSSCTRLFFFFSYVQFQYTGATQQRNTKILVNFYYREFTFFVIFVLFCSRIGI